MLTFNKFFVVCIWLNLFSCIQVASQQVNIIPSPQIVNLSPGSFQYSKKINVRLPAEIQVANPICHQVEAIEKNIESPANIYNEKLIWVGDITKEIKLSEYFIRNGIAFPDTINESYAIHIHQDTIVIGARDHAGLLYGLYSLDQLVIGNTAKKSLPNLYINDFPKFINRAVMDDISRGPLSNMSFLKEQIKRLSYLKINMLSFYIEHVVKTKKHASFAPGDALSVEEFAELSEFAKPYNIELIGSFQSLGHFRNILSTPDYTSLGQTDRMLKPADEQSIRFLTDVYTEMLPAFSSSYFNINADEAWDLVRGDLTELAQSIGPGQLYANHVNPLLEFLTVKDRRPMIWGDMLLSYPKAFNLIPENTTILTWEYGGLDTFNAWIDPIREAGFDYWVCPGIVNSYQVVPDYQEAFVNIENFVNEGYEKNADGVMTTIWDDGGGHLFGRDWAAVAWAAEQSWFPRRGVRNAFLNKFSNQFYQDSSGLFMEAIFKFNALKHTSSLQSLNTAFLEEIILPEPGNKHFLNTKDLAEVNVILEDVGSLIEKLDDNQSEWYRDWIRDLDSWKLSIDHVRLQTQTYKELFSISNSYHKGNIQDVQISLERIISRWVDLKMEFVRLWLNENRRHWLEEATQVFDSKIEPMKELLNRIESCEGMNTEEMPSKLDMGLDIVANNENFFTFWLVSDFYEMEKQEDFQVDYLKGLGGELTARPTPYDWLKYQSPFSERVDFNLLNSDLANSVVYLYCRIECKTDLFARIDFEYDDYWELILNGTRLKNLANQENMLKLVEGKNHLILKLAVNTDNHEVSFRLNDLTVRNRKQKYKIVQN